MNVLKGNERFLSIKSITQLYFGGHAEILIQRLVAFQKLK